ncbi:MAG: hypothetical protein HY432_00260 [Candidatus Liptonbacteria bacterium]|nr:hypothetical protein [Candidatus Liptonbacteria bacterium]
MLQFILTTILMASLGTMLYLMARSLPRVEEEIYDKPGFMDKLASSEVPEKIDAALNDFVLKFLRKIKVILLKVDNSITEKLKKISPNNGNGKPRIDFKDLTSTNGEKTEGAAVSDGIEKTPDSDNN